MPAEHHIICCRLNAISANNNIALKPVPFLVVYYGPIVTK